MEHSDRFVEEIIHGFEIMIEFDLRSVIAGTRSISRAVHHLPTYLTECKDSGADIKALESWAHIFIEPVNLVQTIAANANHHSIRVAADVVRARGAYKNHEWFQFGSDIGQLLAFLTTPVSPEVYDELINQE